MLPTAAVRYTLDAASLLDDRVRLNGSMLALGAGDELPPVAGAPTISDSLTFAQATITFLTIPGAGNNACR
jgi:heparanase